ncbi:phage holin, LLH family [Marinitoga lauensis]|uniref:phage holin, LLH family n=1 Tax=Marinitoga lauensis TaxID=2201189 RepID=UPI0010139DC7|nr:phage holin, LLH family [Marinitoga lauensis]
METIVYVLVGIAFVLANLFLHSKKMESKIKIVRKIVTHVVEYVEQIGKLKNLHGEAKKNMAMVMAKKALSQMHIKISDELLDTIIESIVFYLNLQKGVK